MDAPVVNEPAERTKLVSWSDPALAAKAGRALSGVDYLDAIRAGDLPAPPAAAILGIHIVEVARGRVVMRMTPAEHLYNTIGSVHGGIIATLLDSVMGCAVHSSLPPGQAYATLEIKVNYVRPVTVATGEVTAEGRIVHAGRRSAVAEASLTDTSGKLLATASTTCMVVEPRDASANGAPS